MAMEKQKALCKSKGWPMFAPKDGICWGCHRTVEDSDNEHITGHHGRGGCNRTFCD